MPMHEYQKQMYKKIGVVAALIILPIASFFVGMNYQKQMTPPATSQKGALSGQRMKMANLAVGEVKEITSTNITITSKDGVDKTYTITSDTAYKDGESNATAADIAVSNKVMLALDPNDNTKVKTITANPVAMFRGGPNSDTTPQ